MKLYENIKNRRKNLGMTQAELASQMGYSGKSMISRIENGDVDLSESRIMEFARVLDTTPQALMGWEVDESDITDFHASVDYLMNELSVADQLQLVLSQDESIGDYKFSDDQLLQIIRYARFLMQEV